MLVWCMLICSCVAPSDGMMRLWPAAMAGPAYVARRSDIPWRDTALADTPKGLLLSKDPKSIACQQYFQGRPEGGRAPWHLWAGPAIRWAALLLPTFVAMFFFFAILRKQWVEYERLQFPLARVPLEFTAGSAEGRGLLPTVFSNKTFLMGLLICTAFRALRAMPLLFGAESGWNPPIPFEDVLRGTALENLHLVNVNIWWNAVGFAYLVPADVSLSIWFFYLFGRTEMLVAAQRGSSLHYGGSWSQLQYWQMAGSYLSFTAGALFMARHHLLDVAKKALGLGRGIDDSEEPVRYGVAFWGFLISMAVVLGWFTFYGMKLWVAVLLMVLVYSILLSHARITAQSGMYVTQPNLSSPNILHGLGFGRVFGPKGAVLGVLYHEILINGSTSLLAPPAIHAMRISEVFERSRRRWLVPALVVAVIVGMGASGWTAVNMAYNEGAVNFGDTWGEMDHPRNMYWTAHQITQAPYQHSQARWVPFGIGLGLTGFVMFMRARFYWWPIHAIGLLGTGNWHIDRMWVPFLMGWLIKTCFVKFGSGRLVREARFFFIALILVEAFWGGVSTIVRTLTDGAVPGF
jgi:hypothetical protein